VKKFRKRFNHRLVKRKMSYSVKEICKLFGVHPNTVLSWINKEGLERMENIYPHEVYGGVLADFIAARQSKPKIKLAVEEFKCFGCKVARKPRGMIASICPHNQKLGRLKGFCDMCSGKINKIFSLKNLPEIQKVFSIQQWHISPLIEGENTSAICETERKG
jgi:Putative ATPase subunit of terminase (gpP-like)